MKRLQRQYDEAKNEIKRLKNIVKRTNPERLAEMLEADSRRREKSEINDQPKEKKVNGPRCKKCHGFKLQVLTFTRADGTFTISICKADHCGHRSPPIKSDQTESNSHCENNELSVMEVVDEHQD